MMKTSTALASSLLCVLLAPLTTAPTARQKQETTTSFAESKLMPSFPKFGSEDKAQPSDELNAYEAVIRHKITDLAKGGKWKKFYLACGLTVPHAPDDRFMERFVTYSKWVLEFQKSAYSVEQMRKEDSLVIGVYSFKEKSTEEAEVEGYCFLVAGEAEG